MTNEQILEVFNKHNALLEGHFLLSSGLHSDKYLQCALIMQYPAIAERLINDLVLQTYHLEFTTVVSPAIGGIRFGYEFARQLRKRSLFTERVDDVVQFRRGFVMKPNEKVVIAEDVVTTGKSTKECMKAVRDAGGDIQAVVSLVDRSSGEAQFDVPFISLLQIDVHTYDPADCPLCRQGTPAIKPGSRNFKA
ncbi:MAG: orotate phosphoribosyltransferase [Geovibrio sp.]|jgi:orotate phosphoribosyltransferase|uniref:orotate phosphoribosyltransferase n=1 Tax=Geovibrio ferrireducens TaxID=46201 RepID=UPI00224714B3|nr:orotate phosphoribosyltransferase [Geovibrio ferrireducens]MCD8569901.1 orotate phosphoribosyltransferase [Geovibrio sp.]